MKSLATLAILIIFAVWSLYTGSHAPINYERLVWGGLAAWLSLTWCWCLVPKRVRRSEHPLMRRVSRLISFSLSVAPGIVLGCYGWFAPAAPSLTNGGVDVCELETGFCVSGTRAFIYFGGFTVVWGLIADWVIHLKPPPPRE